MLEHKITGLPVTEDGKVVGILSQGDVFRVLTSITGVYRGGVQFALNLEDRPGSIKDVADVIRKHGGRMVSILTSYDMCEEGCRNVYIRIADMAEDKLKGLIEELEGKFTVVQVSQGTAQRHLSAAKQPAITRPPVRGAVFCGRGAAVKGRGRVSGWAASRFDLGCMAVLKAASKRRAQPVREPRLEARQRISDFAKNPWACRP